MEAVCIFSLGVQAVSIIFHRKNIFLCGMRFWKTYRCLLGIELFVSVMVLDVLVSYQAGVTKVPINKKIN